MISLPVTEQYDSSIIWDVFYDECKADGYWHCFLFIPQSKIQNVYDLIIKARSASRFNDIIHYKNIGQSAKLESNRVIFVRVLMDILLYIIQQQKIDATIDWNGERKKIHSPKIGARLAILRKTTELFDTSEPQTLVEATFRMGLKGALHYLFNQETPVIDNIYVDYSEESFNRSFDEVNLWERVKTELKKNINFANGSSLKFICKKDYNLDCPTSQIMQFVDVILGSFRTCVMQNTEFHARYVAAEQIRKLLLKDYTNHARMINSRYYKGFTLSDASLDVDWVFEPMKIEKDKSQYELFDL